MGNQVLTRIEAEARELQATDPRRAAELSRLLRTVRRELRGLGARHPDTAERVARAAEAAIKRAARPDASALLLKETGRELERSMAGFEASHPRLAAVVAEICARLAALGI